MLSLVLVILGQAQVVYEPLDQSIYAFLQRTYVRGLHNENLEVIPLDRTRIAECLYRIRQSDSELSANDKEELEFYERDLFHELRALRIVHEKDSNTWHLYQYADTILYLTLDPILGANIKKNAVHRFSGAKLYGQLGNVIGYTFHFTENAEFGTRIDKSKKNIPSTGINLYSQPNINSIEYSDIRAAIGVKWGWGCFSLGKDYINWGMGQRSKLILSSKAPSFPFLRLDLRPTEWLRFYYLHGWLQSDVLDSISTYDAKIPSKKRNIFRPKYIAAHFVSVSLLKNLNISFGESIIYSDMPPNLLFLNPILFYRAVDHYLTTNSNNDDGNNSQIFLNADFRVFNSLELFGSLFIDEIRTTAIFNEDKSRNQLGYSLGIIYNSQLLSDATFTAEYTRILPWVYSHYIQTQTYESDGYLLGHYIGQNSDQIYLKVDYRIISQLQIGFFYDYIRKGGLEDIHFQYVLPSLPFLYGTVTRNTIYGMNLLYEPIHDMRFGVQGFYENKDNEKYGVELQVSYGLF